MLTGLERALAAAVTTVLGAGVLAAATPGTVAPTSERVAGRPAAVSAPPAPRVPQPSPIRTVPKPAAPRLLGPIPAPPAPPLAGCPVPTRPGPAWHPKPLKPPAVDDAHLPRTLPPTRKASSLTAVTAKGVWITNWRDSEVDVDGVVARAKGAGLASVWVRTGGSKQGYYGDRILPRLVPAAHRAGLSVVAWDFPFLSDPVADAARAKQALDAGIDAFAPDVETPAEGTHTTARRVGLYLSIVRRYAGSRPVAATVPRPTTKNLRTFPYAAFQPYADVFTPMVYWSCHEPGELVVQSLSRLGRWLPVAPVGQGYDMAGDGGRHGLPSRAETWRFLDVARRGGAVGASLWTIEQLGAGQWQALAGYPWQRR